MGAVTSQSLINWEEILSTNCKVGAKAGEETSDSQRARKLPVSQNGCQFSVPRCHSWLRNLNATIKKLFSVTGSLNHALAFRGICEEQPLCVRLLVVVPCAVVMRCLWHVRPLMDVACLLSGSCTASSLWLSVKKVCVNVDGMILLQRKYRIL